MASPALRTLAREAHEPAAPNYPRVVFVAPDAGLDLWRSHWPAQALEADGAEVTLIGWGSQTIDVPLNRDTVVIIHSTNMAQRYRDTKGLVGTASLVQYCKRAGARVALNLDDDYVALRDGMREIVLADTIEALHYADLGICATTRLSQVYARWCQTATVRNLPPRRVYEQRWPRRRWQVGWMGRVIKHPAKGTPLHAADVAEVLPALRGLSLYVVGEPEGLSAMPEAAGVKVRGIGECPQEPFPHRRSLYQEMGRVGIGMAPLIDNDFNRSKSWIKPLEYAISGTPCAVPAWHPAFRELAQFVPLLGYFDSGHLRRVIDLALGQTFAEYQAFSAEVRAGAERLTIEGLGLAEWRSALSLLA